MDEHEHPDLLDEQIDVYRGRQMASRTYRTGACKSCGDLEVRVAGDAAWGICTSCGAARLV